MTHNPQFIGHRRDQPKHWSVFGSENPWANKNNKIAQVKVETLCDSVDHLSAKIEDQTETNEKLARCVKVQSKEIVEMKKGLDEAVGISKLLLTRTTNNADSLRGIANMIVKRDLEKYSGDELA